MKIWLLFLLAHFIPSNAIATASCGCKFNEKDTFSSPTDGAIENIKYFPIYTTPDSYLVINKQRYFWSREAYKPTASRPVVCREKFNDKLSFLSRIFFFDDDNSTIVPTLKRLNNPIRPKIIVYDCRQDEYCCDGECCKHKWIFNTGLYIFFGVLGCFIAFCFCNQLYRSCILHSSACFGSPSPQYESGGPTTYYTAAPDTETFWEDPENTGIVLAYDSLPDFTVPYFQTIADTTVDETTDSLSEPPSYDEETLPSYSEAADKLQSTSRI